MASPGLPSHEQVVDAVAIGGDSGPAQHGRRDEIAAYTSSEQRQQRRRRCRRRRRRRFDCGCRDRDAIPRGQELATGAFPSEAGDKLVDELLGRAGGAVDVGREGSGELREEKGEEGVGGSRCVE